MLEAARTKIKLTWLAALAATADLPRRLRAGAEQALRAARQSGPLDWLELASSLLVMLVFWEWFRAWYHGNHQALWDPKLQPDDARTAIFPFHRYEAGAPLADDPIAQEMLEYQPYAYRLLFRVAVPLVGVLYTTKLVQALLFGLILISGYVLARSRRAGLGAGLLLAFFFLHDQYLQNRVLGGLPRGFGFPLAALWIAGAMAERVNVRRAAALLAALTYPTALAMVLAAEGIFVARRLGFPGWRTAWRRVRHYALLVAACGALLAPAVFLGMSKGGPVHTLEEARREPAFTGRLRILPFGDPGKEFGTTASDTYSHYRVGESPYPEIKAEVDRYEHELGVAMLAVFLLLPLFGWSAGLRPIVGFFAANLVLYGLSRFFAFRLYSPERYYSVGMRATMLALAASAIGTVGPGLPRRLRHTVRNFASAVVVAGVWVCIGNGVRVPPMGATIDYRQQADLWDFIGRLPKDARIATHIMDGDEIPLFAARATNGTSETLQPWLTLSWKRQKARAQDTLRAMYATSQDDVLEFAQKYRVSHILVNRGRYHDDFRARSKSFEPFTGFANGLLAGKALSDLVLASVPPSAVVFKRRQWQLIDVSRLAKAWEAGESGASPPKHRGEPAADAPPVDDPDSDEE